MMTRTATTVHTNIRQKVRNAANHLFFVLNFFRSPYAAAERFYIVLVVLATTSIVLFLVPYIFLPVGFGRVGIISGFLRLATSLRF